MRHKGNRPTGERVIRMRVRTRRSISQCASQVTREAKQAVPRRRCFQRYIDPESGACHARTVQFAKRLVALDKKHGPYRREKLPWTRAPVQPLQPGGIREKGPASSGTNLRTFPKTISHLQ